MPQPKYGARDELADRLDDWIERLSKDRSLPWMGLGLIADLRAARDTLNGVPEKAEPEAWEIQAKQEMEFDL